jgi:ribonuclease R
MARARDESEIEACLRLLEKRAPRPLTIPQMAGELAWERYDRKRLKTKLEEQVAGRVLRRIGKTRYLWLRESQRPAAARDSATPTSARARGRRPEKGARLARIEGRYSRAKAGYGFVEALGRSADRFRRDILIPRGMEGGAMHGDRVEVEIAGRDGRLRRTVGRVVAVTGPVHERVLGALEPTRQGWCLLPESDLLPPVRIVGGAAPEPGQRGLVALVRLTRPPAPQRWPEGELERIVGSADDPEVQFLAVAFEHGLRTEFPDEVREEAERLPVDPDEAAFSGRRDLRSLPFVTIDGETARDFDDAVCLEKKNRGHRLWVAIADVSRYVRPRTPLDREAALRGTSVYFPDRAIPMLPARLSSELCSLEPGRPRLALVVEMDLDERGRRQSTQLYRGVIQSRARLTYTNVAAVLSDADTPEIRAWREELGDLLPRLEQMRGLMRVLYRNRVADGSLDLDLPEALVDLSEAGRSVGIRLLHRNDAHRLIEELMLEANRAVASFLGDRSIPLPYRIHEPPDPADIDELNEFIHAFGLHLDYDERVEPEDVQRLLTRLEAHRLSRVLSRQVLRSLKQAQYSTRNAGHFGLAFPVYCHFTSPIRRYPDLLVHRQLGRFLDGDLEAARNAASVLEDASVESSRAERDAMEAERAMLDLKKAEFMLDHLLEPEEGTIVSVLPFGFFVELDAYPIEGLVHVDSLRDDRYRHVEAERALVGLRKKQRYRIGDRVLVEATNVSLRKREIDFALLRRLDGGAFEKSARRRRPAEKQDRRGRTGTKVKRAKGKARRGRKKR